MYKTIKINSVRINNKVHDCKSIMFEQISFCGATVNYPKFAIKATGEAIDISDGTIAEPRKDIIEVEANGEFILLKDFLKRI